MGLKSILRVAIQGELGSNSHVAALQALGDGVEVVACARAYEVLERLEVGGADAAVLPIENSLHGSVFEHYDLVAEGDVRIVGETLLRIRHCVIAASGVRLEDVRRVSSHPVALSQCRRWLRAHAEIAAVTGYDTAGSVKEVMAAGWRDAAGIAPALAAQIYGGTVLADGIEDHAENFTRFYVLKAGAWAGWVEGADKLSVQFALAHEAGALVTALQAVAAAGGNLTKIESRPVEGKPWEYVFFLDVRFAGESAGRKVLEGLGACCLGVKVLGVYVAA